MTDDDYDVLVRAMKATVKRIAIENTWLRHSLMEMEARITAMTSQLGHLEARAKALHKSLRARTPPTATSADRTMTESKQAATAAKPKPSTTRRRNA